MTLLIISLALTNMAVGYGLAVYLGHGKIAWRGAPPVLPSVVSEESPIEDVSAEEFPADEVATLEAPYVPHPVVGFA